MNKLIVALFTGLFINQSAFADTRIVIETPDGKITTWSNDKYTRSKLPTNEEMKRSPIQFDAVIGDFRSGKTYMLSNKQKLLVEVSTKPPMAGLAGMFKAPKPKKLEITYKSKGPGKTIAGLKTMKYDFIVRGKKCFEVWLTKDAAFAAEMKKHNLLDTSEAGDVDDDICEQANNQDNEKLEAKYGYAVKALDANGKSDLFIKEFKTNVTAPKKYLSLPSGYKIMTMMEAMTNAMSKKFTQ